MIDTGSIEKKLQEDYPGKKHREIIEKAVQEAMEEAEEDNTEKRG